MTRRRVLVTGAGGQLGREIVELAISRGDVELYFYKRAGLDVTNADAVMDVVRRHRPDVILHTAAYTAVDKAETDVETAHAVNVDGARHLAQAAEAVGSKLCHVSTDYVFSGDAGRAYREDDETSPLGVYGVSKELGEREVMKHCSRAFVVRTSWLYGAYGPNFLQTMLRIGRASVGDGVGAGGGVGLGNAGVRVVDDQTGCPTWTRDLAALMFTLVESDAYGIYHGSNTGHCTWYGFAKAIFAHAGLDVRVTPVTTAEFPRPAKRPVYSVLAPVLLEARGFTPLRPWDAALADYFRTHEDEGCGMV